MTELQCNRCGYMWQTLAKVGIGVRCPSCKTKRRVPRPDGYIARRAARDDVSAAEILEPLVPTPVVAVRTDLLQSRSAASSSRSTLGTIGGLVAAVTVTQTKNLNVTGKRVRREGCAIFGCHYESEVNSLTCENHTDAQ